MALCWTVLALSSSGATASRIALRLASWTVASAVPLSAKASSTPLVGSQKPKAKTTGPTMISKCIYNAVKLAIHGDVL